ncbi:MAG: hypothetical protein HW415_1716 [Deltaproteobacteria bacterium]|nr:hypothetical protein [Deltaproteobacteria bacterium]
MPQKLLDSPYVISIFQQRSCKLYRPDLPASPHGFLKYGINMILMFSSYKACVSKKTKGVRSIFLTSDFCGRLRDVVTYIAFQLKSPSLERAIRSNLYS